jgi:hypothetical protein
MPAVVQRAECIDLPEQSFHHRPVFSGIGPGLAAQSDETWQPPAPPRHHFDLSARTMLWLRRVGVPGCLLPVLRVLRSGLLARIARR